MLALLFNFFRSAGNHSAGIVLELLKITEAALKNRLKFYKKNTSGALYVILMHYSPPSLGFELMLTQSTGDYTGAFTN